jgi:hypothetical protein
MFQNAAFQSYSFQTAVIANDNTAPAHKEYNAIRTPNRAEEIEKYQAKIRKEKTELQKLDSVVAEFERKKSILKRSKTEAKESEVLSRLAKLELQYIQEINRLMQVRAMLLLRIKQDEEALIVLLMQARRRLRA